MTWSVIAQRRAAEQAALVRTGYVPLLLSLGTALETQNLVSAQLNHITEAKNPSDARGWIETQRRLRPLSFAGVRSAADRGLMHRGEPRARVLGGEIVADIGEIERFLAADNERFRTLFEALEQGDAARAESARGELVEREVDGARRLRDLARRVEREMDELSIEAAQRERRAIVVVLLLGAGALAVGLGLAAYARRVLAPLSRVTARAEAVARGDLTPQPVVASPDEIGELASTFESMVLAIGRARGELVQAERLAAVGRMAAHVTHEIRNPISAMGLNVELLEEELQAMPEAVEARELTKAIGGEIERLRGLTEQYLGLARRPSASPEPGDLGQLVRELVRFVTPELERAKIETTVRVEDELPEVRLDEGQIRQAVLNLVRNAREAMPGGGALDIEVKRRDANVVVTIDDTGEGIPEAARASLFDPFFTTKRQGTGLGLAVVREIVEAHGGTITCDARVPRGTRFTISLPT